MALLLQSHLCIFIVVAAFYKASPYLFLLFKFAASIVIGMSEKNRLVINYKKGAFAPFLSTPKVRREWH